jgi:hypothetical protein
VKPGPIGSYEELVDRALLLRRIIKLRIHGHSHRAIARELGIARTTLMRMKPEVAKLVGPMNLLAYYDDDPPEPPVELPYTVVNGYIVATTNEPGGP